MQHGIPPLMERDYTALTSGMGDRLSLNGLANTVLKKSIDLIEAAE